MNNSNIMSLKYIVVSSNVLFKYYTTRVYLINDL